MTNLFHVSPKANEQSILKSGVDPIFSKGKAQLSWFVSYERLPWALAHCSARHNLPVSELVIFTVPSLRLRKMRRTRYDGIYATPCRTRVDISAPAIVGLNPQGVNDASDII